MMTKDEMSEWCRRGVYGLSWTLNCLWISFFFFTFLLCIKRREKGLCHVLFKITFWHRINISMCHSSFYVSKYYRIVMLLLTNDAHILLCETNMIHQASTSGFMFKIRHSKNEICRFKKITTVIGSMINIC